MIRFRGTSRYSDDRYREGFALECAAMRADPTPPADGVEAAAVAGDG